jgi:DNA excision repair protein ERCC-1
MGPPSQTAFLVRACQPFIDITTRQDKTANNKTTKAAPALQCLHRPSLASMDDNRPRAGASASARPEASNPPAPGNAPKVQQPKPQALPSRSGPSSILVSPRQKGNPILNSVRSVAWEYSDIPADYVVGATTCALFLSLKYHRLHPEYIYNRIRDLKGQYSLRILLTMVDIENHEDPLRELSKTSLVNNVTVMLCWSAQEAGRYLELFKTFENAAPTSIRAQQAGTYSEKMVEFITVPRSINKTDAVGLVSNFGSIRTAINAGPEEIGLIAGWGDKKVQRWCNSVREPFRVKKAARRTVGQDSVPATMSRDISMAEGESQMPTTADADDTAHRRVDDAGPLALELERSAPFATSGPDADNRPDHRLAEDLNQDDEEAMREAEQGGVPGDQATASKPVKRKQVEEENMSEGVMAALSKLRKQ